MCVILLNLLPRIDPTLSKKTGTDGPKIDKQWVVCRANVFEMILKYATKIKKEIYFEGGWIKIYFYPGLLMDCLKRITEIWFMLHISC
eukprot:UN31913